MQLSVVRSFQVTLNVTLHSYDPNDEVNFIQMHAYMYILKGDAKVAPIPREEKGSRNLTDGTQGQSEYSIYSVCPLLFHVYST